MHSPVSIMSDRTASFGNCLFNSQCLKGNKEIREDKTCMCVELAKEIHIDLQLHKTMSYANTSAA